MRGFGTFLAAIWSHTKAAVTGTAATLIGLSWQTAQWIDPTLAGPDFRPSIFWGPGLLLLFHASFLAWRQEHDRATSLEAEGADSSRPNVMFDRAAHSDMTLGQPRTEHLHVWEIWFRNRPEHPDHRSPAKDMTANVEFCNEEWRTQLEFVGVWAESTMPEHVGWVNVHDRWTLPPTHTWAKLVLLGNDSAVLTTGGRWSDQPDARGNPQWVDGSERRIVFALSGECLHAMTTTVPPQKYWLDAAVTRLRVTLTALNMAERVYQFALTRDAQGAVTAISEI